MAGRLLSTALEKYRADKKITAGREAQRVVALHRRPGVGDAVRRASRIASKSSAEPMVVHVIRDTAWRRPRRSWAGSASYTSAATTHHRVGDDVLTALLDFAERHVVSTVGGTSRRTRWARLFDDRRPHRPWSGGHDVHMDAHPTAGLPGGRGSPGASGISRRPAALVVPR